MPIARCLLGTYYVPVSLLGARTIAGNKPDKASADPRVYILGCVCVWGGWLTKNNDLSKQGLVAYAVNLGIGEAEAEVLASLSNKNKTDNSKTTTVIRSHHNTRQLIASGKGLIAGLHI